MKMRDVTGYPLSPNQRKEVEEYMSNHNVTENEARYALGYVPLDLPQVSVTEALEMVKEENPNVELTYETLKFYLDEVMKKSIPKPNPKLAMGILIKYVKPIECPHCGYEIEVYGFNNALNVELIEDKKSAIMCPMCFTPFEK
jgi:DNA-directed RNA polymerase subunit RPC12/RpoP